MPGDVESPTRRRHPLWPDHLDLAEEGSHLQARQQHPRIAVGDGITDWELRERGCVDTFIAFTEHVRRDVVLERCDRSAASVAELRALLEEIC